MHLNFFLLIFLKVLGVSPCAQFLYFSTLGSPTMALCIVLSLYSKVKIPLWGYCSLLGQDDLKYRKKKKN